MKIHIQENQLENIEGMSVEYPYAYHHESLKETKVPWHWHEEMEIGYVKAGRLKVVTVGKTRYFEKDQGFFMNSNVLCVMEDAGGKEACIYEAHLFHPVFLGGHFRSIFETKYLAPVLQNRNIEMVEFLAESTREKDILRKIRQLSAMQSQGNVEFQTRNLLSEIWLLLLEEIQNRDFGSRGVSQANQERIQHMLSYIHEHYGERIRLEEIAAAGMVSGRECLRCFQTCIHKTPFEYLLEYRVEMAERLLKNTRLSVTEIALETGFSSAAYFGKIFRKNKGKSPGAFRKQYIETENSD